MKKEAEKDSKTERDGRLAKDDADRHSNSLPAEKPNYFEIVRTSTYIMYSSLGIALWSDGEWYV